LRYPANRLTYRHINKQRETEISTPVPC